MTGESTSSYHITRKKDTRHSWVWMRAPIINYTLKVRWPLCFICSCASLVTQCYKCARILNPVTTESAAKSQKKAVMHSPIISHAPKSEVAITLICGYALLVTQHYRRIETFLLWFHVTSEKASRKPFCTIANRHLVLSVKRTGTKEDKGSTMMLVM